MSSSIENRDVRSISIGSKISLIFKDSSIIEEQPALVGIIGIDKTQEDEDSHFPEMVDLLDKVWIQIGENERIYGDKKRSNEAIKEEIVFSLSEQMIEDFKHTEMMYAGVNHRKYNIKTKEIALSTVKSLAEDFK
jgi:hypothetical protein|tara:strand:- start:155 stop:559 length:405 start_codon:yes stop_codon:yes gene_type:complete